MTDRSYPHLVPQQRTDGKLTGDFECSECKATFRRHLIERGAMTEKFNVHLRCAHPPIGKPRENVSHAAARIVREAVRNK